MIELPDGAVLLQDGEAIPAYCRQCDRYYPAALHSEQSKCPWCFRETIHAQTTFQFIEPKIEATGE